VAVAEYDEPGSKVL
jgi:hypothetical protein